MKRDEIGTSPDYEIPPDKNLFYEIQFEIFNKNLTSLNKRADERPDYHLSLIFVESI